MSKFLAGMKVRRCARRNESGIDNAWSYLVAAVAIFIAVLVVPSTVNTYFDTQDSNAATAADQATEANEGVQRLTLAQLCPSDCTLAQVEEWAAEGLISDDQVSEWMRSQLAGTTENQEG